MRLKQIRNLLAGIVCALLVALPTGMVFAQSGAGAQGGVFGDFEVQPGAVVEVPLEIRDVAELYAVDLELHFEPAVVQVQDANPDLEGVQPALGMFLDAGLTLFNTVDNEAGVVRFVMTQVNPSEAKSGSGVVLVLYLQGVAAGVSEMTLTSLELSTRSGEAIPVETVNGTITVAADATKAESTPIPIQDQDLLVAIPTVQPTQMPTEEPADNEGPVQSTPEEQTNPGVKEEGGEVQSPANAVESEEGLESSGFTLLNYWWVVLIVVVLAIGFGIYLWVTRK